VRRAWRALLSGSLRGGRLARPLQFEHACSALWAKLSAYVSRPLSESTGMRIGRIVLLRWYQRKGLYRRSLFSGTTAEPRSAAQRIMDVAKASCDYRHGLCGVRHATLSIRHASAHQPAHNLQKTACTIRAPCGTHTTDAMKPAARSPSQQLVASRIPRVCFSVVTSAGRIAHSPWACN
jgi:hypothetical protein